MKGGKFAPMMVLVMGMGAVGFWASSMLTSLEDEASQGKEDTTPLVPEPAPVRVEASARGGALNALRGGAVDQVDAGEGADGGGAPSAEEVGRGGALAGLERRRQERRAGEEGQPEEDWSQGERAQLGPARWMPKRLSEAQAAELESELDEGEMRQAQLLAMREDRQRSIEVVAPRVEGCFAELRAREPERKGRLALTWTMLAGGGVGLISDARVRANVGLREPGFETCFQQGLQGLSFDASGESELLVEWVFAPGME